MNVSVGRITAHLAETPEAPEADLVRRINGNVNPPQTVTVDDVHIRAMYVVSDEINSFGGCFPSDEHPRLAELLVDSPVLVGHRKDKLPVARTFHAQTVEREGRRWVKSYFYWLKTAAGAGDLRENIDGGIYKECSIGFTFGFPECSICGADIRTCEHEPLREYRSGGQSRRCHFNYRQIDRVLETSLVYRGAVPHTSISRELTSNLGAGLPYEARALESVDDLESSQRYLAVPYYEGLPVRLDGGSTGVRIRLSSGEELPAHIAERFADHRLPELCDAFGWLVALRGKERLDREQLCRYLAGRPGRATRLEVRLFPPAAEKLPRLEGSGSAAVVPIPHAVVERGGLEEAAAALATRDGVRLWPVGASFALDPGFHYRPRQHRRGTAGYRLVQATGEGGFGWLHLSAGQTGSVWRLGRFHHTRLMKGSRFIAERVETAPAATPKETTQLKGAVLSMAHDGEACLMQLAGALNGRFVLRPTQLNGVRQWLFYRVLNDS